MPRSSARQAWADAFRPACRARGMRFVSEEGFLLDDVYLTSISTQVFHEGSEALRITWDVSIKPLAIDEVLWAAFLPDVEMGPKMRINRRINGAFTIQPLRLSRASHDVAATDEPDWEPVLDEFDRVRADFIADHPTAADFVSALRRRRRHRPVQGADAPGHCPHLRRRQHRSREYRRRGNRAR